VRQARFVEYERHTLTNHPWSLVVAMEFSSERDADSFEKYLKSGSGRAFLEKALQPNVRIPGT